MLEIALTIPQAEIIIVREKSRWCLSRSHWGDYLDI